MQFINKFLIKLYFKQRAINNKLQIKYNKLQAVYLEDVGNKNKQISELHKEIKSLKSKSYVIYA